MKHTAGKVSILTKIIVMLAAALALQFAVSLMVGRETVRRDVRERAVAGTEYVFRIGDDKAGVYYRGERIETWQVSRYLMYKDEYVLFNFGEETPLGYPLNNVGWINLQTGKICIEKNACLYNAARNGSYSYTTNYLEPTWPPENPLRRVWYFADGDLMAQPALLALSQEYVAYEVDQEVMP